MKVEIYSKSDCQWCDKAKEVLTSKAIRYIEHKYGVDYTADDLKKMLNRDTVTVPQIFIGGKLIGDYHDLLEYMENNGIFGIQN